METMQKNDSQVETLPQAASQAKFSRLKDDIGRQCGADTERLIGTTMAHVIGNVQWLCNTFYEAGRLSAKEEQLDKLIAKTQESSQPATKD